MFKVGQRVVCVRSTGDPLPGYEPNPHWCGRHIKKGDVVTVRDTSVDTRGSDGLRFYEINNPIGPCGEWGYIAENFRPLDDIPDWTAIVDSIKEPEQARDLRKYIEEVTK